MWEKVVIDMRTGSGTVNLGSEGVKIVCGDYTSPVILTELSLAKLSYEYFRVT